MDIPENPAPGTGGEIPTPPAGPRTFLERRGISPVAFGALCVVFFFLVYEVGGSLVTLLVTGGNINLNEPGGMRALQGAAQVVLLFVPALLLARLASPEPLVFLRLKRPSFRALFVSLAGILSLQVLLQVYMTLQDKIPLPSGIEKIVNGLKDQLDAALMALLRAGSFGEFLGVVTVIALIPALAEEFAFRGVIQRSFEKGMGPVRAIVVTGIIFGAFHLNPFSIVPLVTLGIYLGFLAWRADSIWMSVAAHFFNNMLPVGALYFGLADESVVKGDIGDTSPGLLAAMFLFSGLIFLLSTYYFLQLTRAPATSDPGPALL
jgi:membrane protease YdiL (CAAX protease family)